MLLVVSIMSTFNIGNYNEKERIIANSNIEKDGSIVNQVTDYSTIVHYNAKLPSNITNVKKEGNVGLSYKETTQNETKEEVKEVVVQEVSNEVVEKGTGAYGIYKGRLTGYGPDCVGCTGTGNLACRTREKTTHSLVKDGIYYEDTEYGKVRILAAALKAFPCGTIIEVTKPGKDPFMAVVLDTGTTMVNSWNKGIVWLDLAYSTQKDKTVFAADDLTGKDITFSVQRWGW